MPTTKKFNPDAKCPILARGANNCPFGCSGSYVLCHYYRRGQCYYQSRTSYCSLGWHDDDDASSNCDKTKTYTATKRKRSKSPRKDEEPRKEKDSTTSRNEKESTLEHREPSLQCERKKPRPPTYPPTVQQRKEAEPRKEKDSKTSGTEENSMFEYKELSLQRERKKPIPAEPSQRKHLAWSSSPSTANGDEEKHAEMEMQKRIMAKLRQRLIPNVTVAPPAPKKRPRRRHDVDGSSADLYFHLARMGLYDIDTNNKLTASLRAEDALMTAMLNSQDAEERLRVLKSFSFVIRAIGGHGAAPQSALDGEPWWRELLES